MDWSPRLLYLRGSRGVGKTTMMLQHMKDMGREAGFGSISCLVGCDSKTRMDEDVVNQPAKPGYFVSTNIVDIKENIRLMCESLGKNEAVNFFV